MEYAISYDHGQWAVLMKGTSAVQGIYPTLEVCLAVIQRLTGAPVILKVLTALYADGVYQGPISLETGGGK
jgi:hypothetical protein